MLLVHLLVQNFLSQIHTLQNNFKLMATELSELIDFLSSPSPQLQQAAISIIRDLTGSSSKTLAAVSDRLLPPIRHLIRCPPELSIPAAETLINLTESSQVQEKAIESGFVSVALDVIYSKNSSDRKVVRLLVMLLVNLTQVESGADKLIQVEEKTEGLNVSRLVRSFCSSSSDDAAEDTFEHVASILVNISKTAVGRNVLLAPKGGLLKQIIRQFDSANSLRKTGVCGTIRNCCFEADNQLQNLLLVSEYLWPALLLPVAGNKVYSEEDTSKMPPELANALSHERQSVDDPEIRKQALESIYLIALQEAGRRALWSVNGPRILQVGYADEEDPKVMEAYELVGSLLVDNAGAEQT